MSRIKTSSRKQPIPDQHKSGRSSVASTRSKDLKARLQTTAKKRTEAIFLSMTGTEQVGDRNHPH